MRSPLPLIALVLLAALLVAPAGAVSIVTDNHTVAYSDSTRYVDLNVYDPARQAIYDVELVVNPDTHVELTFYNSLNQEITAEINRTSTGPNTEIITYRIGDDISGPYESGTFLGLFGLEPYKFTVVNYASNTRTDTFPPLSLWLRNHNKGIGWKNPMAEMPDVAVRLKVDATRDVDVTVSTVPVDDLRKQISDIQGLGDEGIFKFVAIGMAMLQGITLVITLGWYLFQKIFIENFYLALGLYEIIGAAYAANTSRDIFQFFKKFYQYNLALAQFMYRLIDSIFSILARIIDALKIW